MFEIYDSYYHMGLFTKDDIALFVEVGDLTQDQADKILKPATETVAQG
ncbi:XkdX family protein [Limosilactobacillus fermentum]|nr:XkdX family protein [Limosilactobacillus fermentum]WCE95531.1 XkdX family protein [Limosilactobacillus fermentum]